MAPEVDGSGKKVSPMMTTADMAMITDPDYRKISKDFMKIQVNSPMLSRELGLSSYIVIWVQNHDI